MKWSAASLLQSRTSCRTRGNAEGVDASTAQEFLDKVLSEKAALLRLLAAQLLTLVKWESLLQHEQDLLNRLATDGGSGASDFQRGSPSGITP